MAPRALIALLALVPTARASDPDFSQAEQVLERAIAARVFPGCAVAVGTSERSLWRRGYGRFVYDAEVAKRLDLPPDAAPGEGTLYDLASLSKVVGTTAVFLALVRDQKLALCDPVAKWVPDFAAAPGARHGADGDERDRVTLEHLLAHASGLPAWRPLFREVRGYDGILRAAAAVPLESAPGSAARYSDLGFILLGEVVARAGGKPLPELERELIFAPLGMTDTLRNPPASLRARIPPTELDPATGAYVHGEVHDENCRAAGGVTGHAGLFSSARDLSFLAAELLRALRGESRVFPREIFEAFVRRRGLVPGSSRALGWDTPSAPSSGGDAISPRAFGHTGFTGTSLWVDPARDLYFVLLSNRVHPSREGSGIAAVRRELADAVLRAVDAWRRRRI
jgi:CubicO group peptidase (beta-lactamase class C family)